MSDLKVLLEKALEAVRMDLNHVTIAVIRGKLKANEAKDLVAYTKLLTEALEQEKKESEQEDDELAKLPQAELELRARKILQGN